jgi:hypothetical protein
MGILKKLKKFGLMNMKEKQRFYASLIQPRKNAPPKIRKWIEENKNKTINQIIVCRKPIQSAIRKAANIISGGSFNRSLKRLNYDEVFHLYLYIRIGNKTYVIEKNEVVTLTENVVKTDTEDCLEVSLGGESKVITTYIRPKYKRGLSYNNGPIKRTKIIRTPIKKITLKNFMTNGEKFQKNFWSYNAKNNNCQNFVQSLLVANKLIKLGDKTDRFIKQDAEAIFRNNPDKLYKLGIVLTNLAGAFDNFKEGYN